MAVRAVRVAPMTRREVFAMALRGAGVVALGGSAAELVAACGGSSAVHAATSSGALKALRIGNIAVVNFAPVYRLKTLSAGYGFAVEFVDFANGTERLNALAAGDVDAAPTGVAQPILLRSKGVPVKIVADTDRKGKGLMAGPNIHSIADLKGKTIASVPGSGPDVFLREKLIESGLDPNKDVTLVNVDFLQMSAAVLSGRVSAASGNEPYVSDFLLKGGKVISYLNDTKLGNVDGVMVFPDSFIKGDRSLAKEVVAAMAKAVQELKDPNVVVETMAGVVNVDQSVILKSLDNLTFSVKPDAKALGTLAQAMKAQGSITTVPATDDFLDMSLIPSGA